MNVNREPGKKWKRIGIIIGVTVIALGIIWLLAGCSPRATSAQTRKGDEERTMNETTGTGPMPSPRDQSEPGRVGEAIFAGGCFWCIEAIFQKLSAITAVVSGYTGGSVADPSYKQVTTGTTGHFESIRVRYDPSQISYTDLLGVFWWHITRPIREGSSTIVAASTARRSST